MKLKHLFFTLIVLSLLGSGCIGQKATPIQTETPEPTATPTITAVPTTVPPTVVPTTLPPTVQPTGTPVPVPKIPVGCEGDKKTGVVYSCDYVKTPSAVWNDFYSTLKKERDDKNKSDLSAFQSLVDIGTKASSKGGLYWNSGGYYGRLI
jgi:hypothetical protein